MSIAKCVVDIFFKLIRNNEKDNFDNLQKFN